MVLKRVFIMTFGRKIKYLREKRGLTQDQLAEETGIHPVTIRKYETDKTLPKTAQLERISEVLEVKLDDWVNEIDYKYPVQTHFNFLDILFKLYLYNFIEILGERDSDGKIISEGSKITFKDEGKTFLSFIDTSNKKNLPIDSVGFDLDEKIKDTFFLWESYLHKVQIAKDMLSKHPSQELLDEVDRLHLDLAMLKSDYELHEDDWGLLTVNPGASILQK